MTKKRKIIAGVCAAVCVGGLAAGLYFGRNQKKDDSKELAYVMRVSSMNDMAGTQRMAGVVESQKTLDIQKDNEREIKEVLVKTGDAVDVGTPLFVYDTAKAETDLQQANLDLERTDNEMVNLKAQMEQLQKEKERLRRKSSFLIPRRFSPLRWI